MKHRNKRISLSSYLLTHLSHKYRMVYKVTNIKEMQNEPRGQMEERGQYLQSSTDYSQVKF
jgi:hypothetical protein